MSSSFPAPFFLERRWGEQGLTNAVSFLSPVKLSPPSQRFRSNLEMLASSTISPRSSPTLASPLPTSASRKLWTPSSADGVIFFQFQLRNKDPLSRLFACFFFNFLFLQLSFPLVVLFGGSGDQDSIRFGFRSEWVGRDEKSIGGCRFFVRLSLSFFLWVQGGL